MSREVECQLEVLAFIEAVSTMPAKQLAERWPEWHGQFVAATERFNRECSPRAPDWRDRRSAQDPMVGNLDAAWHYWCYLPLIRAALTPQQATEEGV